jgi:hypothetical protein
MRLEQQMGEVAVKGSKKLRTVVLQLPVRKKKTGQYNQARKLSAMKSASFLNYQF